MPHASATDRNPYPPYSSIAVVGAGAWGTALAIVAAGNTAKVLLWARESEIAETLVGTRENTMFLPGVLVPESVEATLDIARAGDAEVEDPARVLPQ